MSSSMATAAASSAASTISSNATGGTQVPHHISASAAQFREIHKNTWLKRLTAEGKKVTVGPKRCERSWVVFCVHDDTEALLEGYAEPRQAASHSPEWIVSMQDTLHISHALIPNSHEFEFVVTLSNEVIRFHAMSWEIMQEWVETLRSKLREMKILSPRENLYTKLPEIRAPLLPTRDPTSPLPAPPPVPAALVPGVERVVPHSLLQENVMGATVVTEINGTVAATTTARATSTAQTINTSTAPSTSNSTDNDETSTVSSSNIPVQSSYSHVMASHDVTALLTTSTILTSMSNTLTQNLLNMLSDPISTYSEHLNDENLASEFASLEEDDDIDDGQDVDDDDEASISELNLSNFRDEFLAPLLRKSSVNIQVLQGTNSENSVRVDISATNRTSADQIKNLENLIPRPQTSRSLSAGAADSSRKQVTHFTSQHNDLATSNSNNITEFEISSKSAISPNSITQTSTITAAAATAASMAATTTDPKTNITIIQVSTNDDNISSNAIENESTKAPKLPIKNITAEIFKFPETHKAAAVTAIKTKQHEYKSNVQIIPSNLINTIQVLGQDNVAASKSNQYSTPVKKNVQHEQQQNVSTSLENNKITTKLATTAATVAVGTNTVSIYGTCYTTATSTATSVTAATSSQTQKQFTPKLPKKIILSANTSGITNIAVNNTADTNKAARNNTSTNSSSSSSQSNSSGIVGACDNTVKHNVGNVHYEKVFLSSSIPITTQGATATGTAPNVDANACSTTSTNINVQSLVTPMTPKVQSQWNSPRRQGGLSSSDTQTSSQIVSEVANSSVPASPTPVANILKKEKSTVHTSTNSAISRTKSTQSTSAAAAAQLVSGSPANLHGTNLNQPPLPTRPPFLTRGLTEAVITTRPSRRDVHFLKLMPTKTKSHSSSKNATATSNNNGEMSSSNVNALPMHAAVSRTNSESIEQRKRSSSTSDARNNTRGTNNNEFAGNRIGGGCGGVAGASGGPNASIRIQQPPQSFRSVENNGAGNGVGSGMSPPPASTVTTNSSPGAKRMNLREQQVMQLRREIMHPGGVRLQLRRKDCVGSIAWVDAFGAVWVAGWKQKEHPVLYNALHIGDQLLSIAGISISSAGEANKIIRNSNTLFVEVLVRRIPFGRGYAIRREREGQCLGLIRDGNTSTIVDVVPNSLAARHGLPPKSQSCDGTTLTFWVLTEINGRPLNLFFKEYEIRDRLNSVGRDISILVQPSDLITKLKKQLKSLRGYKDYLVQ